MVAGGAGPLLFVWDLAAAELLYALHLPLANSVYGTSQLHFMPDSQTVAGGQVLIQQKLCVCHTVLARFAALILCCWAIAWISCAKTVNHHLGMCPMSWNLQLIGPNTWPTCTVHSICYSTISADSVDLLNAALGTHGLISFIDVVEGNVCCKIEPASQKQAYTKMAIDNSGDHAALITQEGEV